MAGPSHPRTGQRSAEQRTMFRDLDQRQCPYCLTEIGAKGLARHMKTCREDAEARAEYEKTRKRRRADSTGQKTSKKARKAKSVSPSEQSAAPEITPLSPSRPDSQPQPSLLTPSAVASDDFSHPEGTTAPSMPTHDDGSKDTDSRRIDDFVVDDIKVKYHPSSHRPTTVHHFEDYVAERGESISPEAIGREPWYPFRSRVEFEFAELTHQTHMNHGQIKQLLKLVKKISAHKTRFTFDKPQDVTDAWDKATVLYPSFSKTTLASTYKKDETTYDFHSRSLWDWIMSQVRDTNLAPHFHWDAQRKSKYTGQAWDRVYEEPWMSDKFWDVQTQISKMDPNAKPLAIHLWSDKTKLSSHGTQKGHPIIARIGNLPADIRNGTGLGGGRIVGFLPIVKAKSRHRKKTSFRDFRNAIFHESFTQLLQDVKKYAKIGYQVQCGDEIMRRLFPYVAIVSADYEEQCAFASIRGLNGLCPCVICYVPKGTLSDLETRYPDRDSVQTQALVKRQYNSAADKDIAMKEAGLRPTENAFWDLPNTDIFEALSFDRLHAYHLGLWGTHLWGEFKRIVNGLGPDCEQYIDDQVAAFPSWRGLIHFDSAVQIEFSDGKKWADLSKIIIYTAYNILTPARSPQGYALLKLIRKYIECDIYGSLDVHTETTLKEYEQTLLDFHSRLQEYIQACQNDEKIKNWNGIIKVHSHIHAIRDIRSKGVLRNMDTKPNEKFNGPLRTWYLMNTNFRNVEAQLAKLDDYSMAASFIRANLEAWDDYKKSKKAQATEKQSLFQFGHIYLGSRSKPQTVANVALDNMDNPAYNDLRKRIGECLTIIIANECSDGGVEQQRRVIRVSAETKITICSLIRINYESAVTWREETDLLRCSPEFHGKPRHDFVLANMQNDSVFCQLILVFTCTFEDHTYALALVKPLDAATGSERLVERDLALCRLRERQPGRNRFVVIPARSIRRGALVIADKERHGEYVAADTLDSDMFLRLISKFPNRNMAAHRVVSI